jgi:rifampicin phosphotransferase
MSPLILPFADPNADLETVGGKGMSLANLTRAGLPVPGGFHITTSAYRSFVAENGIQSKILKSLQGADPSDTGSLDAISQAITGYFVAGRIPSEIDGAIREAYNQQQKPNGQDMAVAVRSSATAEDLPGASFAGQQETYLNIRGAGQVVEAVKKCWASLWTARAIAYRLKNSIDQESVALAVVVQELVFADAAGVLFTANPVNGHRQESVINAAWGLGEAIVSGAVTPDTLIVDRLRKKVIERQVSEKSIMTVRTKNGTEDQPVPDAMKNEPVMTNSQAIELTDLGIRIETVYGTPMDIEWTLAGGKFAIVQARPITALPPEWISPDPKAVFARGSLAEHIPTPVTQLFSTLGLELANAATQKMWDEIMGGDARNLVSSAGFYTTINGFMYGGTKMGLKELGSIIKISVAQIGPMFRNSASRWQAARNDFVKVVEKWESKPLSELACEELYEGVRSVFGKACWYFTRIQTTLPAASMSETIFTKMYTGMVKKKNDPDPTVFLLGFDNQSLQAEKSLYDLAAWIKNSPALLNYLVLSPTTEMWPVSSVPEDIPSPVWVEWQRRFDDYLNRFGRIAYEFDFANPTPMEAPAPILEALKRYLRGQANNPYERQQAASTAREQAELTVISHLRWPLKNWFLKVLRWTQENCPVREDSIADMGMGHPVIRRMLSELGRRFVNGNALERPEDIYWLEDGEVKMLVAHLADHKSLPDLSGQIPARKAEWRESLKYSPPIMIPEKSGWSRMIQGGPVEKKDGMTILKGVGTSNGTITAPACVLLGPEDFSRMQPGCVLVAVTTTPAWTPLFSLASAVVTDIGGPLSHSSIIAREYNIPAVMAARGASHLITNGKMVTVDGSKGTVAF